MLARYGLISAISLFIVLPGFLQLFGVKILYIQGGLLHYVMFTWFVQFDLHTLIFFFITNKLFNNVLLNFIPQVFFVFQLYSLSCHSISHDY